MSHGSNSVDAGDLDPAFAGLVAETMQALATASRVRILGRLRTGSCAVSELAEHIGMEASAVSHQLRILRHLGLVVGHRDGRRVEYELHDEHVGQLIDEAISHVEHLRLGHNAHEQHARHLSASAR